jgi:predicted kinase
MLILVAGLPGSGKSFFAEKLAGRIGADYLNSDQIRLDLHATGKYTTDDKLAVYKMMVAEASAAIETGKDVVADATFFHHALRELFVRLAEAKKVPVFVIEVIAEEALIRKRLTQPRKRSEADFNVYEGVRDAFEEITMPHLTLTSTDDNIERMITEAINYLGK